MDVQFEARKQELLEECEVAPQVFERVMPRLERFMQPFVESLSRTEQVHYLAAVLPNVLPLAEHADPEVRWTVVRAAAGGEFPTNERWLKARVADSHPRVRAFAAAGLINKGIDVAGGRAMLAGLAGAPDAIERQAAAEGISEVHAGRPALRFTFTPLIAALLIADDESRVQGMGDRRRLPSQLRGEGDDTAPAPPTVEELPELAAGYRRAGLDVELDLGSGVVVSPVVGATVYRVAQESLANAAKHGSAGAEVHLVVDGAEARLVVRNPCPAAAVAANTGAGEPGSGLLGMKERVLGLGGTFYAGPRGADGGLPGSTATWVVEATLPVDVAAGTSAGAGSATEPAGDGLDRLAGASA